jgi:hypothetical protein
LVVRRPDDSPSRDAGATSVVTVSTATTVAECNADATAAVASRSVHVSAAQATAGGTTISEHRAMSTSSAAAAPATGNADPITSATADRDFGTLAASAITAGVQSNDCMRSALSREAMAPPGSRSIARVRARHESISSAYRRTRTTECCPASSPAITSIANASDAMSATSRLDTAIVHNQAKAALTGLGWKAAIAHAAVTAAAAALGPDVALERLIFESLRRCPKPLGTITITGTAARSDA